MKRLHHSIFVRSGSQAGVGNTYACIYGQAMQAIRRGAGMAPHHRDTLALTGGLCFMVKNYSAAERYLREAIAAGAGAQAHTNLGLTLAELRRPADASSWMGGICD